MPTPTEEEIHVSAVEIQQSVDGIGQVHDRIRIPTTDAEFKDVCVDNDGLINVVFIRPAAFGPESITSQDDYNGEFLTIEFIYMFGYVLAIPQLSDIASERAFYSILFATKNAYKAKKNLNFSPIKPEITHTGFRTASDIPPPQIQGDYLVHYAACRLTVHIGEC